MRYARCGRQECTDLYINREYMEVLREKKKKIERAKVKAKVNIYTIYQAEIKRREG